MGQDNTGWDVMGYKVAYGMRYNRISCGETGGDGIGWDGSERNGIQLTGSGGE